MYTSMYTCLLLLTSVFFFQFSLLFILNKRVRCLLSIYLQRFAIIWILTKETVLGYASISIRLDNLNVCCRDGAFEVRDKCVTSNLVFYEISLLRRFWFSCKCM